MPPAVKRTAPPQPERGQPPFRLFGTGTLKCITFGGELEKEKRLFSSICVRVGRLSPPLPAPRGRPCPQRSAPLRRRVPGPDPPARERPRPWLLRGRARIPTHGCSVRRVFPAARRGRDTQACAHPSPSLRCLDFSSPKEKPAGPPKAVATRAWLIVRR